MKTSVRAAFAALVLAVMVGCAHFGIPTPKTFNERLALGYTIVTNARTSATALLTAEVISVNDAENTLDQTDNLRQGLDVARDIHGVTASAGDAKLEQVMAGLVALDSYLCQRKGGHYDMTKHLCEGGTL